MQNFKYTESRLGTFLAIGLSALLTATAGWAASEKPGQGRPPEGLITIATGNDANVDGFLSIAPDDFGEWASVGFTGGGDIFNPAGAGLPIEATFSSGLWLFIPSRSQRIILTENASHLGVGDDFSLALAVTSPLAASDSSGNSVNDTLMSSFTATGTDTDLSFDLTQSVMSVGPGVALVRQDYVITNNSGLPVDMALARVYDGDLLWDGDFANDQVGTGTNAAGGDVFVFMQEASDPGTSITISSPQANSYFGGKNGVQPAGGPPPYNFGTDTEVFDAFGVPATWVNHIAGVGYDADGVSGTNPPGSVAPEDGFIGLGFNISLAPSESTTVTVMHTYGQAEPGQTEADLDVFKVANIAGEVTLGTQFDWFVTVTNFGPGSASGVVLTDTLPDNLDYISGSCDDGSNFAQAGNVLTANLQDIPNGGFTMCTITTEVSGFGLISNEASVTSDTMDPDGSNNTSSAQVQGAIQTIPTMSRVGLFLMTALLLLVGVVAVRRFTA